MFPRTPVRAGPPKEPPEASRLRAASCPSRERLGVRLRAHEVAKAAGISKNTLLRWLKAGKVPEVARDRNGWRIFTQDDLARVRAFAERTTPPGAPPELSLRAATCPEPEARGGAGQAPGKSRSTFPGKEEAA